MTFDTPSIDLQPPGASPAEDADLDSSNSALPLTVQERTLIVEMLKSNMGLRTDQAQQFIDGVAPSQARMFLALMTGNAEITREQATAMWGLSPEQADFLFPAGKVLSTFSNPFGRAFIMLLMLTYSLEIDLRGLLSQVIETQKEQAIAKAEDNFRGAIAQFACAMVAGIITGVFAGKCAISAYKAKNAPMQKNPDGSHSQAKAATDNMWFGPIGASLINQPISATGEFVNAWYQREGLYHDANVEEARAIFQQLMSTCDSTGQLSKTAAQGLLNK